MTQNNSNSNKLFDLLTICRKAGKLEMGFDPMKEALAGGKAHTVITASDISQKTEKEVRFFADKKNVTVKKAAFTIDEVYMRLGKRAGILTICDGGFAERAVTLCGETETDK